MANCIPLSSVKKTFTGLGMNYFSNIYHKYKIAVIQTLLNRAYELTSTYQYFDKEIKFLKNYFTNNFYPPKLFNSTLKKFLARKYHTPNPKHTAHKMDHYTELPFIGSQTKKLIAELRTLLGSFYPQINVNFYFKNNFTIGSYFNKHVGDSSMMMRSSVVYPYNCDCCQQSYIGSTRLQMFVRCARHAGVSFRTNKPYSSPQYSTIRDHCHNSGHCFKFSNFSITDTCRTSDSDLRLLESIYINRLKPSLNRNQTAIPLNIVT